MENWQYLLLIAGLCVVIAAVVSAVNRHRERKQRDFTRSLETLLRPRESVKVICPQKKGRCILTSHRLIFERKGSFRALELKDISRVQGTGKEGKTTASPAKMTKLTVKAEKDHVILGGSPEFPELAAQLTAAIRKQNEKKKAKKSASGKK